MAGNAPHIPGCRDLSLIGERVARSLFSATSDRVGRPVTVTVFPPLSEGRTREDFDRAAATAQRLGAHPSVLTIHEWGHAPDGRPWVVTEPQPAESVDTLLTMDGPLEVERALQVGVLLAGALETAHRAGIVHGDLSPARLVFGVQGEPLLAETGLAPFAVLPGLGALNNPVRYHAPPEVLERTEITPATDVYSLATTVYALLAGRAPQQKPAEITDSNASLLLRVLQMPVPPIDRPDLPRGLFEALRGPLSPSPSKRPQQAIDVAWLLQDAQRRAGLAITEPVVLDLDEIGATGTGRRGRTGAGATSWTAQAPAAAGQAPAGASGGPGPTAPPTLTPMALTPPAPPSPALSPPALSPPALSPGVTPPALSPPAPTPRAFPAAALSPSGDDPMPADPWAEAADIFSLPEPEPPPPTIFPFAGDGDAPPTTPVLSAAEPWPEADDAAPAARAAAPDDGSPWSSSASAPPSGDESGGTLWPSTWPSGRDPSPTTAGTEAERPWPVDPPPSEPPADSPRPTEPAAPAPAGNASPTDASPAPEPPDEPWSTDVLGEPPPDSPWSTETSAAASSDSPWSTETPASPPRPETPWSTETSAAPAPSDTPWSANPAAPPPTGSPWSAGPAAQGGEAPAGALWPSTWPADTDRPPYDTPAWAATPPGPDGPDTASPAGQPAPGAAGGDGGSISDLTSLASGNGTDGDGTPAPPSFPLGPRPPELDELPAWYTDPLPSAGGTASPGGGTAGHGASPGTPRGNGHGPVPGDDRSNGSSGALDRWGDGSAGAGIGPHGNGGAPAAPSAAGGTGGPRLPGAGDELRSLFGEVVGDGDEAPPAPPGARSAPRPLAAPGDDDPLGPPDARPPIDLSQLDTPLGPAPFLPPSTGRPGPATPEATAPPAQPVRLPRRHEVQSWPAGGTQQATTLPRAGKARADRSDGAVRSPAGRPAPGAGRPAAASGPPALPLIVLIAVVAVLVAGVAWLVLTGDESPPPASERSTTGADAATGTGGAAADDPAAPTDVRISQGPEGMQVAWTGAEGEYVVTVLSADQPPKVLPPTPGPSVLVPNADLGQGGAWCFTVAAAVPEASPAASAGSSAPTTGPASEPACTPGATVDAMRGA
jgi:Protein kinase domain